MIKFIKRHRKLFLVFRASVLAAVVIAVGCNSGSGKDIVKLPGPMGGDKTPDGTPTPSPNPDAEGTTPNRIVSGVRQNTVAVGLSSFAMGVTNKFPLEDNQNIEGIGYKVAARAVNKIATNELYTFPEKPDPAQVKETIKFFIDNGHQVVHEIHILCGPCMRIGTDRFVTPYIPQTEGNSNQDEVFIDQLYSNQALQQAVLDLFHEVVLHAKELEGLGAEVYICPELEDNHSRGDSGSYGILLNYLKVAGWQDPNGDLRKDRVVRNGGSVGNIAGIRYESHGHDLANFRFNGLRPGDFFNMDGNSFYFNSDENKPSFQFSEDDVRTMVQEAEQRNLVMFVWHSELQGLVQAARFDYRVVGSSRDRAYILKKPKDQIAILQGVPVEQVEVAPAE